jgi:hypothetical protein
MWRAEPPQRPRRVGAGSASKVAHSRQLPAWATESERTVPVDVPFDRVLINTSDLVVFIAAVHVYPSGFSFTLSSQLRPAASAEVEDIYAEDLTHGFNRPVRGEQAERSLRLGVQFADGRKTALHANLRWPADPSARRDEPPRMRVGRISSDSGKGDHEISVVGLPGEGDVTLFYQWLGLGVPEGSVELDGDALRSAAARAVVLWDNPTAPEPDPAG